MWRVAASVASAIWTSSLFSPLALAVFARFLGVLSDASLPNAVRFGTARAVLERSSALDGALLSSNLLRAASLAAAPAFVRSALLSGEVKAEIL
jgi:hypothetical protein